MKTGDEATRRWSLELRLGELLDEQDAALEALDARVDERGCTAVEMARYLADMMALREQVVECARRMRAARHANHPEVTQ